MVRFARRTLRAKQDDVAARISAAGPTPGGTARSGTVIDLPDAGMGTILSGGRDTDIVRVDERTGVEVTVAALRKILLDAHGLTPESFAALPPARQHTVSREMIRLVNRAMRRNRAGAASPFGNDTLKRERTELHVALREWATGPLTLEHPQGSSYHHLLEYDARAMLENGDDDNLARIGEEFGHPQIFVVERDWARAFAGYDLAKGESPLPFPHCCFEFRISGVRVLAFFREDEGQTHMFCVYGRGGVWVCDDYGYWIGDGTWRARSLYKKDHNIEFPRVARLVADNVRVACIMVDADVAQREVRQAPAPLVRKRVQEGRPPPRDHYVMDLKRSHAPTPSARTASSGGTRAPQRGHFRRGTWVHYDDPESGQVQYADNGGFWHSRTWRHWHFAGDPKNLITKEYRL